MEVGDFLKQGEAGHRSSHEKGRTVAYAAKKVKVETEEWECEI